jgi:hypothetical protein
MVKYLTGVDYTTSCNNCKRAIDDAHGLIELGIVREDYIIDPEGPSMLAYDRRWLCDDVCEVED